MNIVLIIHIMAKTDKYDIIKPFLWESDLLLIKAGI